MDRKSPEPPEKKQRVHYGSIEEAEKQRLASGASINAPTPNIFKGDSRNTLNVSEEGLASKNAQDSLLKELERKKRARHLAVPTDDKKVKLMLRELGHPICLFGELPHQRRDRLRDLLSKLDETQLEALRKEEEESSEDSDIEEEFFTEGSKDLKEARFWILNYSLPRARARIAEQMLEAQREPADVNKEKNDLYAKVKTFSNSCSQIGDDRPIAFCRLNLDQSTGSYSIATGSWSGVMRLWELPSCKPIITWRGHDSARIGGIDFHPESGKSLSKDVVNLVSGAADGTVRLWSLTSPEMKGELVGHKLRVSRVAFHPSGRFIGTTSYDSTWRLWDANTTQELLLQEGHFNEVYGISFHPDGSLVATSGLDSVGRVWDLRTGRSIYVMEGHVKQVLGIDFSPDGHHIATGSDDNTVRIWDLRKRKCVYTIPAHQNLVAHVKFEPVHGRFLVSSSFDNTVRIWGSGEWKPIKSLIGHENKVLCSDISEDGTYIASCSYDRTFKIWEQENL